MTHKPPKPPEGSDAGREKAAGVTRRALLNLFRGTRDKRAESDGKPPEASVAHDVRERIREQKGPHRRGVLAAGVGAAVGLVVGALPGTTGAAPQNAPASSGTSGWPGGFVERYKIPEWGAEELERMADAFSLLSGYRTNPSFWRYVTNHKMESAVYEAIDHVLKQPELFHYKDEGDGVIRIMPRGALWGIPPDLAIEIKGGLEKGRLTRIGINGANLEVKPHASLSWEDYKEVLKEATDEYIKMLQNLAGIEWMMARRPNVSFEKKLKYIRHWAKDLPPAIRRDLLQLINETEWGLKCRTTENTSDSDEKKIRIFQYHLANLPPDLQQSVGRILNRLPNPQTTPKAQWQGAVGNAVALLRIAITEFNTSKKTENFEGALDFIKQLDISRGPKKGYKTFDDYSKEMAVLPEQFRELMKMRGEKGYLDPTTEDPAQNLAMQTFLDESNCIAYPFLDEDGNVVIKISTMAVEETGLNLNFKVNPVIAFSPDGRVMTPKDDNGDGTPDWENYELPAGKTTHDLVHEKYKAQLGL